MDDTKNVGGRDRLVRFLLAAVLSIVSVRWLRSGKRVRGLLAGVGALGFGYNATTGYCGVNDALDVDTTGESEEVSIEFDESDDPTSGPSDEAEGKKKQRNQLTCAACGDPIVPGQSRGPNADDDIVHDGCA
ncbi:YgaP family membrane protein [Haloarcula salinisoli]|uniref:DUF2892 domain-containing protein n=1 Tax=Haloarcula salinisoli TaxID=2487746 RepID=A0A8J7YJY9_9EURY|nr:DUF2892 domain-containing protein [Halomicroarcula salinisoli]MBX0287398.1 DUF2892 domain-containing protein [Halomicroarcula salinisoli]MBX0305028.1 DUF2892 domain-containing protein [Halomicroarcula salinisoli]